MTKDEVIASMAIVAINKDDTIYLSLLSTRAAMDEYAKQQAIAFDNWKHKSTWVLFHEDCYVKAEWIFEGEGGFDNKAQRADDIYAQFIEQQNKP